MFQRVGRGVRRVWRLGEDVRDWVRRRVGVGLVEGREGVGEEGRDGRRRERDIGWMQSSENRNAILVVSYSKSVSQSV